MTARDTPSRASDLAHAFEQDAWAARVSAGVAAGSREALAALYAAKFDLLYTTVRRATRRDESFALDCVQDAMLRVATKLGRVERAASLDAWLRRVVLTAALDRLRGERSQVERVRAAGGPITSEQDNAVEAIEGELRRLDALAPEERSLLRLRFARGLTLQQLGAHFGLAPKAIDSRIRRLVARLRGDTVEADDDGWVE